MSAAQSRPFGGSWLRRDADALAMLGPQRPAPPAVPAPPMSSALLAALAAEPANQRPAARAALAKLRNGARVVVSGQQAGLLLGPLYTFHKALSAVAAARALETPEVPVVPVFWVQDEDHDFDEMAEMVWLDATGHLHQRRFADEAPRVPVGDRAVPEAVRNAVGECLASLRGSACFSEAEALLAPWREASTWTQAFCAAFAEAFDSQPILVLRGRDPAVTRAGRELYARAVEEPGVLDEALQRSTAKMRSAGFAVQVNLQADRTLFFYQPHGPGTPRHRLCWRDSRFESPNGSLGKAELLDLLESHPERFSSSALLRPLLQDKLLPVVAQLAGPGEAAYLCQLDDLRRACDVPKPVVSPRGRATWLEAATRRRLRALEATPVEVCGDPDQFLAGRAQGHPELDPERLRTLLLQPLEQGLAALGPLDPSLERARSRTTASLRRSVARFIGRAVRTRAGADAVAARRLAEVRNALLPFGRPQERCMGLTDLVARNGLAPLQQAFLHAYEPFGTDALELEI